MPVPIRQREKIRRTFQRKCEGDSHSRHPTKLFLTTTLYRYLTRYRVNQLFCVLRHEGYFFLSNIFQSESVMLMPKLIEVCLQHLTCCNFAAKFKRYDIE